MQKISCRIILDNYDDVYQSNSDIIGRVNYTIGGEIETWSTGDIIISLQCIEHTEWEQDEQYYDKMAKKFKTRKITLSATKEIMYVEQCLALANTKIEGNTFSVGFRFMLPFILPSSFEGAFGFIRYRLRALVDLPVEDPRPKATEDSYTIRVKSVIDLNDFPDDYLVQNVFYNKKSFWWCCGGGLLALTITLPKMAFIPGEFIAFNVLVTNTTFFTVSKITAEVVKVVRFRVTQRQSEIKQDEEVILYLEDLKKKRPGQHICNFEMTIPEYIEVPNFTCCTLFRVDYCLKVKADVTCCSSLELTVFPAFGHIKNQQSIEEQGLDTSLEIPIKSNLVKNLICEGFPILFDRKKRKSMGSLTTSSRLSSIQRFEINN